MQAQHQSSHSLDFSSNYILTPFSLVTQPPILQLWMYCITSTWKEGLGTLGTIPCHARMMFTSCTINRKMFLFKLPRASGIIKLVQFTFNVYEIISVQTVVETRTKIFNSLWSYTCKQENCPDSIMGRFYETLPMILSWEDFMTM